MNHIHDYTCKVIIGGLLLVDYPSICFMEISREHPLLTNIDIVAKLLLGTFAELPVNFSDAKKSEYNVKVYLGYKDITKQLYNDNIIIL